MEEDQPKSSINFIPCIKWVKRGVAKSHPEKVELTEPELAEIIKGTVSSTNDDNEETEESTPPVDAEDDQLDWEHYDDENDARDTFLSIGNVAIYGDETTRNEELEQNLKFESESEKDDDIIKPDDNLILVGHVEGDASILEVYVYNESEDSLYVHHDFILPSLPLCIEWLHTDPSDPNPGNLCAVGTMSPVIEVWDLDIVDCLESAYVLGEDIKKKSKKSNKKQKFKKGHKDAVLCLGWNENFDHILASGSVDQTVVLWDLHSGEASQKLKHFEDKVQTLQWHPFEGTTLLTGSSDCTTKVFDCRTASISFSSWTHPDEIETVAWNPNRPFCYLAATSDGTLTYVDCRRDDHCLWQVKAHEKEITGLAFNRQRMGMVTTVSNDGVMNVWDINNLTGNEPTRVHKKKVPLGSLLCMGVCPENPFTVAVGGDKKSSNFKVFDLTKDDTVMGVFRDEKTDAIEEEMKHT